MYTLYAMASIGDGNLSGLAMDSFMQPYWDGVRLLFQRIAVFDKPALVHVEPDFWAYAQQMANGNPAGLPVHVTSLVPECAGLRNDLAGLGHCILRLGRMLAPKAVIGFHASRWAGDAAAMVTFLNGIGAGEADVIVQDMLDRDAGCFEAHVDPELPAQRRPLVLGRDATRRRPTSTSTWTGRRPSATASANRSCGGRCRSACRARRRAARPATTATTACTTCSATSASSSAAGGVGITFGVGAGNQTYITTDGDQFKNAVSAYFAAPAALP